MKKAKEENSNDKHFRAGKNEIFKSFAFGMTYDEISDVYEINLTDVKKLLTDNADKINKIKSYYKKMEE